MPPVEVTAEVAIHLLGGFRGATKWVLRAHVREYCDRLAAIAARQAS
jgi:hypothetical protein